MVRGNGKPSFPHILNREISELSCFTDVESWRFFEILELDTTFLASPASEWYSLDSFKSHAETISSLRVVNDCAENGVKLCFDFLHTSKKEKSMQSILQVVENCRHRLPNQRNANHESKKWFIKLETV